MTTRWIIILLVSLSFGLAACGKKPRDVKQPEGAPSYPTQYPTTR